MKQRITYLIFAIFMALINVGCPPADLDSGPSEGEPPIPSTMGKVVVSGNLYDTNADKASHTPTEIGDLFKTHINYIKIWFGEDANVPPNQTNYYLDPFVIDVEPDGNYYSELSIIPANYSIWVEAYDSFDKRLFFDQLLILVRSGETTNLNIMFGLVETYLFEFEFDGLSGNWGNAGETVIVTSTGENYFTSYTKVGGVLKFSAWLPIGFDGYQASMSISDLDGINYLTDLNFDIFDAINGPVIVPYTGGIVNVTIGFDY